MKEHEGTRKSEEDAGHPSCSDHKVSLIAFLNFCKRVEKPFSENTRIYHVEQAPACPAVEVRLENFCGPSLP